VAGCCEHGDETSGSGATEFVSLLACHTTMCSALRYTPWRGTVHNMLLRPPNYKKR
jgi:hypothetical protein